MNEQNNDVLLSVRNLTVEYTDGKQVVQAVNGVSFDIRRRETLGLVGETGAGKTTIAKAILKILPDPPARVAGGEVLYKGRDILGMNDAEARAVRGKEISMVFQDPMTALNPVRRVEEQIAEVLREHERLSRREAADRARDILEMVGIPADRARDYPHQFSGGMKQRVVIAIALACSPALLLADEPTTALDVTIQAQVLELINRLKREVHTSMLLITHNLGVIAESCEKVAVIYAGEIVEYGTREDLFTRPAHPYTRGLFAAVPDIEKDTERLQPIGGSPTDPTHLPEGCRFHPRCPYAQAVCCSGAVPDRDLGGGHLCKCLLVRERESGREAGAHV